MKLLFTLLIPATICVSAYGQDTATHYMNQGWSSKIGAAIGVAYTNCHVGDINNQLNALKLPAVKTNLVLPYIELVLLPTGRDSRFFEEFGLWSSGVTASDNNVDLTETVVIGDINFDYLLLKKRRNYLFAGLGIGYASYAANFTDKVSDQSFQQTMSSFNDERRIISNYNFFVNVNIGYDWALNKKQNILLGARAGYRIGLNKEKWDLTDNSMYDSPSTSASGIWAGINVTVL